jgi:hypothetical protein
MDDEVLVGLVTQTRAAVSEGEGGAEGEGAEGEEGAEDAEGEESSEDSPAE